jgi:hypothetical protein
VSAASVVLILRPRCPDLSIVRFLVVRSPRKGGTVASVGSWKGVAADAAQAAVFCKEAGDRGAPTPSTSTRTVTGPTAALLCPAKDATPVQNFRGILRSARGGARASILATTPAA